MRKLWTGVRRQLDRLREAPTAHATKAGTAFVRTRVRELRSEQPENALSPTEMQPAGSVTEVRSEQTENAPRPTEVQPAGSVTEVRLKHPLNA